jgi:hypothetical protein
MLLTPPNIPVNEFGIPQNQFIGNQFVQPPLPPQQPVSFRPDAVSDPSQPPVQIGPPARLFDAYQSDYGDDDGGYSSGGPTGYGTGGVGSQIGWEPADPFSWSAVSDVLGGMPGDKNATGWEDLNWSGLDRDRAAEAYSDAVMANKGLLGMPSFTSFTKDPEKALDAVFANQMSVPKGMLAAVPGGFALGAVMELMQNMNYSLQAEHAAKAAMGMPGFATGTLEGMPYSVAQDALGRHITGTVRPGFTVDIHDKLVEEQRQADLMALAGPTSFGTTGWSGFGHQGVGLGPADFADWTAAAGDMEWDEEAGAYDDPGYSYEHGAEFDTDETSMGPDLDPGTGDFGDTDYGEQFGGEEDEW